MVACQCRSLCFHGAVLSTGNYLPMPWGLMQQHAVGCEPRYPCQPRGIVIALCRIRHPHWQWHLLRLPQRPMACSLWESRALLLQQ